MEGPAGIVIKELQRGCMLGGRGGHLPGDTCRIAKGFELWGMGRHIGGCCDVGQ